MSVGAIQFVTVSEEDRNLLFLKGFFEYFSRLTLFADTTVSEHPQRIRGLAGILRPTYTAYMSGGGVPGKFFRAVKLQPIRLPTPGDFDLGNNMPKPRTVAPIPKIEVIKNGSRWEVHWDYQEGEASQILSTRADYLRGYINGALDILRIDSEQVCCASEMSGAVKRLDQHQAETLHSALSQLLIPLVEAEFARLGHNACLPHVRLAAADL